MLEKVLFNISNPNKCSASLSCVLAALCISGAKNAKEQVCLVLLFTLILNKSNMIVYIKKTFLMKKLWNMIICDKILFQIIKSVKKQTMKIHAWKNIIHEI